MLAEVFTPPPTCTFHWLSFIDLIGIYLKDLPTTWSPDSSCPNVTDDSDKFLPKRWKRHFSALRCDLGTKQRQGVFAPHWSQPGASITPDQSREPVAPLDCFDVCVCPPPPPWVWRKPSGEPLQHNCASSISLQVTPRFVLTVLTWLWLETFVQECEWGRVLEDKSSSGTYKG